MPVDEINILIAGVGGQGNVFASRAIGVAALKEGFNVRIGETFGAGQRSGPVTSHVRIGSRVASPLIPEARAHILLALEPAEALRQAKYLSSDTLVILNAHPLVPVEVKVGKGTYPNLDEILNLLGKVCKQVISIDATGLSLRAGHFRTMNVVMVGALASTSRLPIKRNFFKIAIEEISPPDMVKYNLEAFELGAESLSKAE